MVILKLEREQYDDLGKPIEKRREASEDTLVLSIRA